MGVAPIIVYEARVRTPWNITAPNPAPINFYSISRMKIIYLLFSAPFEKMLHATKIILPIILSFVRKESYLTIFTIMISKMTCPLRQPIALFGTIVCFVSDYFRFVIFVRFRTMVTLDLYKLHGIIIQQAEAK